MTFTFHNILLSCLQVAGFKKRNTRRLTRTTLIAPMCYGSPDTLSELGPIQIHSDNNQMIVRMKKQPNFNSRLFSGWHFRLDYTRVGCGKYLKDPSGEFQSPNYPGAYPPNTVSLCTFSVIFMKIHSTLLNWAF